MTTITRLLLVPVATQSPTVMTFSSKTPASRLDYTLDLQNRLPTLSTGAFDVITGFTATSSSPDLTVSTNGFSGTVVGVIISGGLLNIIYQIHFVVTTAAGFVIALDIYQSVEPEGLASTTPPVGVVAGPVGPIGPTGPVGPTGSSTGLQVASNLSDLASASTARTNLGLGSMAVQNANAVALTGTLSMAPTGGFSVIDAGTGTLLLKSGSTGSNGLIQAFATLTAPKLTTTGNVVFAGVASATQNGVQFKSTLSGALTAGQQGYLALSLINDTVAAAPTGTSLSGISVAHTTASGATGNRWMADLTTTSGAASTQLALGGIRTTVLSGFNQGGTDLVSNSLGNLFGANFVAQALPGATFLNGVAGQEIDVQVQSGASTQAKVGLAIVLLSSDAVQGNSDDYALNFNNQYLPVNGTGWKNLIGVGRWGGSSPLDPVNGWVMSFMAHLNVGTVAGAGGIDFTNFTPTTAFLRGNGFLLDPAGNWTCNSLKVGANQVIGARDTGWSAMTGATNKAATYDTASVTLAQLAGRVMALQAALTTHGVIGA